MPGASSTTAKPGPKQPTKKRKGFRFGRIGKSTLTEQPFLDQGLMLTPSWDETVAGHCLSSDADLAGREKASEVDCLSGNISPAHNSANAPTEYSVGDEGVKIPQLISESKRDDRTDATGTNLIIRFVELNAVL